MSTDQMIRSTQNHLFEERPQWRLFKSRSSRRAPFHPNRVRIMAQNDGAHLSEPHNLSEAFLLENLAPHAEQVQLTPSAELDKSPQVQFKSESDDIPSKPKFYLLTIPPEILDGIFKWLPVSDQQSVAWTNKILYQKYVPVLQDSSQEFPPLIEDYLLLRRKPQRKKSEIPCCPPEERPAEIHYLDWWRRVRHTESCTLKYNNNLRLCPCLVINPRVFSNSIWELKRDQSIGTNGNCTRYVVLIRNDKSHIPHNCTIARMPHVEASVSMEISSIADERLLVFTEYRIHLWTVAWPDKMEPFHICPHEQDVITWLRAYFDYHEKGVLGWQSDYELCLFCQIIICRGQGPRDLVVRVRSGLYRDPMAEDRWSIPSHEFPRPTICSFNQSSRSRMRYKNDGEAVRNLVWNCSLLVEEALALLGLGERGYYLTPVQLRLCLARSICGDFQVVINVPSMLCVGSQKCFFNNKALRL